MGIVFLIAPKNTNDSEVTGQNSTVNVTDSLENMTGELGSNISADVETTVNCSNMLCFTQKFSVCAPATITSKLFEDLIYYYEIMGPNGGLCEVKSKFLANPNADWTNKEMICRYDNSLNFETAIQNLSTCQGPLSVLMKSI